MTRYFNADTKQVRLTAFTPDNNIEGFYNSFDLDPSGNYAVAGNTNTKTVSVFSRNLSGVNQWGRLIDLNLPPASSFGGQNPRSYGNAVAIRLPFVVIGAFEAPQQQIADPDEYRRALEAGELNDQTGRVYVFRENLFGPGTWGLEVELEARFGPDQDPLTLPFPTDSRSGFDVSLTDNYVMATSPCALSTYIWKIGQWATLFQILSGGVPYYVSTSKTNNDQLIVGHPCADRRPFRNDTVCSSQSSSASSSTSSSTSSTSSSTAVTQTGYAAIYERIDQGLPTEAWVLGRIARPGDFDTPRRYGRSVAITDDFAAIGSLDGVHVHGRDTGCPGNWGEIGLPRVGAIPEYDNENFGYRLDMRGENLIAGAVPPVPNTLTTPERLYTAHVFNRDVGGPGAWGFDDFATAITVHNPFESAKLSSSSSSTSSGSSISSSVSSVSSGSSSDSSASSSSSSASSTSSSGSSASSSGSSVSSSSSSTSSSSSSQSSSSVSSSRSSFVSSSSLSSTSSSRSSFVSSSSESISSSRSSQSSAGPPIVDPIPSSSATSSSSSSSQSSSSSESSISSSQSSSSSSS